MNDPTAEFLRTYHEVLMRNAKAQAALEHAEHMRKVVLADAFLAAGDVAASKAEQIARASREYRAHLDEMDVARHEAEAAKGELEHMRVRWERWRTAQATKRVRMQMENE